MHPDHRGMLFLARPGDTTLPPDRALTREVNAPLAVIPDVRRFMERGVRARATSVFRIGHTASTTARESGKPKREEQQSPKQPLGTLLRPSGRVHWR